MPNGLEIEVSDKASTTAFIVAASLAKLAQSPRWRPLLSGETIRLNSAFVNQGADTAFKRLFKSLPAAFCEEAMNRLFVPGMMLHFLCRKRFVGDEVRRAIANGIEQVVVVGAGFDVAALELARKHRAVQFFEIDLPATQAAKLNILSSIGDEVPENCAFIPGDCTRIGKSDFQRCGRFKSDASSIVVLEGLLMYLPKAAVVNMLTNLRFLLGERLSLVFGAIAASDDQGPWQMRTVNSALRRLGEPTQWHCSRSEMGLFLASLGYKLERCVTYRELQAAYLRGLELKELPAEDENYYVATGATR
jgi:methyltransferase (TIGR00027 family)